MKNERRLTEGWSVPFGIRTTRKLAGYLRWLSCWSADRGYRLEVTQGFLQGPDLEVLLHGDQLCCDADRDFLRGFRADFNSHGSVDALEIRRVHPFALQRLIKKFCLAPAAEQADVFGRCV